MTKMLIPRTEVEIYGRLEQLEELRNEFADSNSKEYNIALALAISSQIHLLKWAFNIEEDKDGDT